MACGVIGPVTSAVAGGNGGDTAAPMVMYGLGCPSPVVVDVVIGRVVGPMPQGMDLGHVAAPVAVRAILNGGTHVRQGDSPLQHFQLETASIALPMRSHGRLLVTWGTELDPAGPVDGSQKRP